MPPTPPPPPPPPPLSFVVGGQSSAVLQESLSLTVPLSHSSHSFVQRFKGPQGRGEGVCSCSDGRC